MSILKWSPQFCNKKIVYGTLGSCMKIFNFETQDYPVKEYGTHISSSETKDGHYKLVIKRFKTKEFYAMYTWLLFSKQI
tara:strand:- start:226 stop:462 length:237 start_codon:yes stop_codon:yes gene_type:complete